MKTLHVLMIILMSCLATAAADGASQSNAPTVGLVGHWEFDKVSGDTVYDTSPASNHGIRKNVYTAMLNEANSCLEFTSDQQAKVIVPKADKLNIEAGTVSVWVNYWWGYDNYNEEVVEKTKSYHMRVYRQHVDYNFWDTEGKRYRFGTYPEARAYLDAGKWHMLTMTYSIASSEAVGYLDGAEVARISTEGKPLGQKPGDLIIGEHFNGLIDDVRVYNYALSASDVRDLYESARSLYESATTSVPTLASCDMKPADITRENAPLYDAWLNYRPVQSEEKRRAYEQVFQNMVVSPDNPIIQTAAEELGYALRKMLGHRIDLSVSLVPTGNILLGTPKTSDLVAELKPKLNLEKIGDEGFVIKSMKHNDQPVLVVAANAPAGVIRGVFALIRRLQLDQDVTNLDLAETPRCELRMINQWEFIQGTNDDPWAKQSDPRTFGRRLSMFSWNEIRAGNTERIRDWARLLSSAGFNAICPTDVNWHPKNNFLEHLDEVKTMADIFRRYGIKLFWTPNYIYAPKKATAEALYRYVPDFGGYLLKQGSEGQPGDPGPENINKIARTVAPYGGKVIIRAFIYGNYFPTEEKHRSKIAHQFFVPRDGQYDENVFISQKFTPYNYEIRAPINPLDGAIKKTHYLSESVTFKWFPLSWVKVRKQWLEFDNYRDGRGSLNKNYISGLLGVTEGNKNFMSGLIGATETDGDGVWPSPSWVSNPLNMVNVYGLGRLNWNPDLSAEAIHNEWSKMTFDLDSAGQARMNEIFDLANQTVLKLSLNNNYRSLRFGFRGDQLKSNDNHFLSRIGREGIGADGIAAGFSSVYAPEVQKQYEDPVLGEDYLLAFRFLPYDYKLTNGRTIIQDIYARQEEGVEGAKELLAKWQEFEGRINKRQFQFTEASFHDFIKVAIKQREKVDRGFKEAIKGNVVRSEKGKLEQIDGEGE